MNGKELHEKMILIIKEAFRISGRVQVQVLEPEWEDLIKGEG